MSQRTTRGRLTIYFGAAPGVGKTFAMLEDARYQRDVERRDVVVGVAETRGRFEIATLLAELERLPMRSSSELDIDAALVRDPELILLDDLAHENAPGSRHPKRWQDAEELLDAGIDVWATLNVQHVESLNDVVAHITGVTVSETVPDSVLDRADELKLIDVTPDKLIERLHEGKVVVPAEAQRALETFFRKGNLIALRELALRRTAERVDAEMQAYRRAHGIERTWAASDRLLVCISPSPHSGDLLRSGRRMAASLRASWYAVTVETPATLRLPAADRARISAHLALAGQLGAETATLVGERAAQEVSSFARQHNVTKLVVGKPRARRFLDFAGRSFVDELILESGNDLDIYVTTGEPEATPRRVSEAVKAAASRPTRGYGAALATAAASTLLAWVVAGPQHLVDVVIVYLLGTVLVSLRYGFRPALLTAVLGTLAFDFFFIPPFHTFNVSDLRYLGTFAVMLITAIVIGGLNQRARDQAEIARRSERRTALLYAMSRDLVKNSELEVSIPIAAKHVEQALDSRLVLWVPNAKGELEPLYTSSDAKPDELGELEVARWVHTNRREAGSGTGTLPNARGYYVPLGGSGEDPEIWGVLGLKARDAARFQDPEQRRLADALAAQIAMAIHRVRLAEATERARLEVEAEQLKSTLLSSVSHDLRTPLAVMKGAASTLLDERAKLDEPTRRELAVTVLEETERLERLVGNVLDLSRLEAGSPIHRQWHALEEVIGGALARVESLLGDRSVTVRVPPDLLVEVDPVLMEQLLVNLFENAVKHTPSGTPIEITATRAEREVELEVADRGPGLQTGDESRVFEKFQHGGGPRIAGKGFGLGLAICRAIATAHGGRISAENRAEGGVTFRLALPQREAPPLEALPELPAGAEDSP